MCSLEKSMVKRGMSARHQFPFDTRKSREKQGTFVFLLEGAGKVSSLKMKNLSHNWRSNLAAWVLKQLTSWFGRFFEGTLEREVTLKKGAQVVSVTYSPYSTDVTRTSIRNALTALAV